MPGGEEKKREKAKFWWPVEMDCFTRVFGDEMKLYVETMVMSVYPDQVVFKKEESSGDELQEGSSSSGEEEEEPQEEEPEEEGNDDIDNIDDNDSSNTYSCAIDSHGLGTKVSPRVPRRLLDW